MNTEAIPRETKLQVWWHVRNPKDPIGGFALSYRPCNAKTGAPLHYVPVGHLEGVGGRLAGELQRRLPECAHQIERFVPPAESRDFGLGPVQPNQWLEAFSYLPQGGPSYERGDLFVAYRHHWPGFLENEPHNLILHVGQIPRSLESMLRTLTPDCEKICWEDYKRRYGVPPETLVPQEYHPPFVFISFLDAYRAIAGKLRDELAKRDFLVFVDREAITAGKKWPLELSKALDQMDFFLPLLAPGYGEGGATKDESAQARTRESRGEVTVISVLVDGAPEMFPEFNQTQMVLLNTEERRAGPTLWSEAVERLVGGMFGVPVHGLTG